MSTPSTPNQSGPRRDSLGHPTKNLMERSTRKWEIEDRGWPTSSGCIRSYDGEGVKVWLILGAWSLQRGFVLSLPYPAHRSVIYSLTGSCRRDFSLHPTSVPFSWRSGGNSVNPSFYCTFHPYCHSLTYLLYVRPPTPPTWHYSPSLENGGGSKRRFFSGLRTQSSNRVQGRDAPR